MSDLNTSLTRLLALRSEFQNTLNAQHSTYSLYLSKVNTQISSGRSSNVYLPGKKYTGTRTLNTATNVANVNACESMCASNHSCTGATYNSATKRCVLASGESDLTTGTSTETAIISEMYNLLLTLKSQNEKLLTLYDQITALKARIQPVNDTNKRLLDNESKKLEASYKSLLDLQEKVNKSLQDYYLFDKKYLEQNMFAEQKNTMFRLITLVMCFAIIIFVSITFSNQIGFGGFTFVVFLCFIISLLIILSFYLSSPSGFFVYTLYLVIIILVGMRLNGTI